MVHPNDIESPKEDASKPSSPSVHKHHLPVKRIGKESEDCPDRDSYGRREDMRRFFGCSGAQCPKSDTGREDTHRPESDTVHEDTHCPKSDTGREEAHRPESDIGGGVIVRAGYKVIPAVQGLFGAPNTYGIRSKIALDITTAVFIAKDFSSSPGIGMMRWNRQSNTNEGMNQVIKPWRIHSKYSRVTNQYCLSHP